MQKMHWCTARLNLAGQGYTILWFDSTNPISWPEAQVLMAVHGEENIYDIRPISIGETSIASEKERLILKYRFKPVDHIFPGRSPRMELLMPAETENLPLADMYGVIVEPKTMVSVNGTRPVEEPPAPPKPISPQPEDDEDEEDDIKAATPPSGPAVFSPGRHPRPQKGA